jgi:hypothetical protein
MAYKNEYSFTKHFSDVCSEIEFCQKYKVVHREVSSKPKEQRMDVEVIYNSSEYLRLEAKIFHGDSRRRSTTALGVFGSLLKGKGLPIFDNLEQLDVVYGVLLPESEVSGFKAVWSTIDVSDWNKFGVSNNVKYILQMNESGAIKHFCWENYP